MEKQGKAPKKKPTKIEEMTKEQIRQAIIKKRECNAKAQQIVESLLEKEINEGLFLQCLPDINQSHFEDIIEERAIIHLCGYPLCTKPLSDKEIPKQKYRISVKTNKVYDITARKSFCSNSCYKSAMFVKNQMLTSPLWFREYENMPIFKLLPLDSVGSLGQVVDLSIIENINSTKQEAFTSINDFAQASLREMGNDNEQDEDTKDSTNSQIEYRQELDKNNGNTVNDPVIAENVIKENNKISSNNTKSDLDNIHQCEAKINDISKDLTDKPCIQVKEASPKKATPNPLNIVGEIIEKPERKIDPILLTKPEKSDTVTPSKSTIDKKTTQKKQHSVTAIVIQVEKCLAEWFTVDTLLFLFGEEKVKEMVTDKGECIKEYLNNYAKGIFYTSNTYDQYQALCRKLNMLELEDRKYDAQALQRNSKPLPDYSILQEESKQIQLKVKAFYSGETEVLEVSTAKKDTANEDGDVTQLPLVDKNAQNALRRRIVCQHLNKVLPDLLRSLNLLTLSISSDVRLLVNTFKLKANNIMFKPIQWTLIAIVIVKLLSLRDKRLQYLLELDTTYSHMQLLLLSYKQDGGYLDRLILWLTDIDRLLNTNDTQLTIE